MADEKHFNLPNFDVNQWNKWREENPVQEINLQGIDLSRVNLTKANLEGANLTQAILTKANLEGVNFEGANLTQAILTKANLEGANLTQAILTKANLEGANLTQAILTKANLEGAIVPKDDSKTGKIPAPIIVAFFAVSSWLIAVGLIVITLFSS